VRPYGPDGLTVERETTTKLAASWDAVARSLIDGAVCACGNRAVRLIIEVAAPMSKADRKRIRKCGPRPHDMSARRFGPLTPEWTLNVRTWCGSTDDDHIDDGESAMGEDDL